MKKIITTALATLVSIYGYSQDGVHLPLTGGTLNGHLDFNSGGGSVLRIIQANGNNYIQSGAQFTGGSSAPLIFGSVFAQSENVAF